MTEENNKIKSTVDAIMDNVIINYDDLSSLEMEEKITYYINSLVASLDEIPEKKDRQLSKTTKDILNNIEYYIALAVYDQVEEKVSIHIDSLSDTLHEEKIPYSAQEDLRETTVDVIMEDIGKYVAGCAYYKVRDQVDYFIGCLFMELRIQEILPREEVKDEVDDVLCKLKELDIEINARKMLDCALEGKRIGPGEIDPQEQPEDLPFMEDIHYRPSMEDSVTERELDEQLSTYFREGGMKMYTGYYPSPPKKRSRDDSSDDENISCCRIKTC